MFSAPYKDNKKHYYQDLLFANVLIIMFVAGIGVYQLTKHPEDKDINSRLWFVLVCLQNIPSLLLLQFHREHQQLHPLARKSKPSRYHAISIFAYCIPIFLLFMAILALLAFIGSIANASAISTYICFLPAFLLVQFWLVCFDEIDLGEYQPKS